MSILETSGIGVDSFGSALQGHDRRVMITGLANQTNNWYGLRSAQYRGTKV